MPQHAGIEFVSWETAGKVREAGPIIVRHGSTAPVNAALARLARDAAHSGVAPGQFTISELTDLLGLAEGAVPR